MTVTAVRSAAGVPVTGSMMCAPRSAVPDVATAKSRPVTTVRIRRRSAGSLMPMRHGFPGAASPATWTSPPPLTAWWWLPWPRSSSLARSIAQPFTSPVGSGVPRQRTVKYPPVSAASSSPRANTSATSGSASATASSPRPIRLTSLSGRNVLNNASTRCSQATTSAIGAVQSPGSRTSMLKTVPMQCSTWTVRLTRGPPCRGRSAGTRRNPRRCRSRRRPCRCAPCPPARLPG